MPNLGTVENCRFGEAAAGNRGEATGPTSVFGSMTGGNLSVIFDNGIATNTMTFRSTVAGATQTDATFLTTRNSGIVIRGFGSAGAQGTVNLASGTTTIATVNSTGLNLASGNTYKINAVQVVGARKSGWAVATGTATRTAFATSTVTLSELAERVKALIDDLHGTAGHGLIGN